MKRKRFTEEQIIGVPVAPIVIGLVLGPIFEDSLRQGLIITDGSFAAFFAFQRPIALGLILVTVALLAITNWNSSTASSA